MQKTESQLSDADAGSGFRLRIGRRRWEAIGILALAILAAVVPFVGFSWRAVGDTKGEIEAGRLALAELAAAQADALIGEAFAEVELATAVVPLDGGREVVSEAAQAAQGLGMGFVTGFVFLDEEGLTVFAVPDTAAVGLDRGEAARVLAGVSAAESREVSEPFISSLTSSPMAALAVPVYAEGGDRIGTMVGLLDLTSPLLYELVEQSRRLGSTGHADLVDERGFVLASTEPTHLLEAGDHPDFYRLAGTTRLAAVERVEHEADGSDDESSWHVMAYAPLRNAPWGIALGASEGETMRVVNEQRRSFVALGVASFAVLCVGAALVVARIPSGED